MTQVSIATGSNVTAQQGAQSQRIPAFDFTKGALVLFMVLYHWLNYFYGPQGDIYKYLRFLTPSFIFITGFLISHVHFPKYGVGSSKLSKRLFQRGVKLLLVFVALNLVASVWEPTSFLRNMSWGRQTAANLIAVFVIGGTSSVGSGKIAAFTILVQIGYLLMLAGVLSIACRFFKYTFHVACAFLLLCMVVLSLHGIESSNVELEAIGLLGVVLGYASGDSIQKLVSRPWAIMAVYAVYLAAISFWNVSLYMQMVGACLTTALIYMVGARTGEPGRLRSHIILLGKYSLFGYISQIAILQLLSAALRHTELGFAILAATLFAGFALTMMSVEAVDRLRRRSRTLDVAYRSVFS
jgi:peptidoglycan/LPS O-acetylase OafA/YrhL